MVRRERRVVGVRRGVVIGWWVGVLGGGSVFEEASVVVFSLGWRGWFGAIGGGVGNVSDITAVALWNV